MEVSFYVTPDQAEHGAAHPKERQISYKLLDGDTALQDFRPSTLKPKVIALKGGIELTVITSGTFMAQQLNRPELFEKMWNKLAAKTGKLVIESDVLDINDVARRTSDSISLDSLLNDMKGGGK
ncbi:MAG TPA: hypothetical protein VGP72_31980 [Planctomycetota bacterium]|jgi:hypothetical protein